MENNAEVKTSLAEIRSEEVQEIITHVPNWIIRWGITMIFVVFLILLSISWFVRYPDVIKAKVVLTTSPAVTTLVSRTSGNLGLLKKENEAVLEGEPVAYIMSNTSLEDILRIEKFLADASDVKSAITFPANLRLGELQSSYNDFLNTAENLANYYTLDPAGIQMQQLNQQLVVHTRLREILIEQTAMSEEETKLAHSRYAMDSTLFAQKLIPSSEHINAKSSYLQTLRGHKSMETSLANEHLQIQTLKTQLAELALQQKEKQVNLTLAHTNALRMLTARVNQWKEAHVFTAPATGTLAYLGFLENNMFAEQGKPLFSIIPKTGHVYGRAEIPVAGSGKIKSGQAVNIRLDNYPADQFGTLHGTIQEVSSLPNGDVYMAKIELNNALITSYNRKLDFKQQLQGETEIITEDLRLLERVFYQFRKLFQFS